MVLASYQPLCLVLRRNITGGSYTEQSAETAWFCQARAPQTLLTALLQHSECKPVAVVQHVRLSSTAGIRTGATSTGATIYWHIPRAAQPCTREICSCITTDVAAPHK